MAISQGKSTRSPSGARNVANRGKRKSELGRDPAKTRLDEKKLRKIKKFLFCLYNHSCYNTSERKK